VSTPAIDTLREAARAALVEALAPLDGVRSVRFVGSYWEAGATVTPGDVDVVVILTDLTRVRFDRCRAAVAALDGAVFGFPGEPVRINDTFGPRKLGAGERVVVHLMIYDVASHRAHVLASPFTCLDWERVDHGYGPSLHDTYPVPPIAPPALIDARRGVANYLDDLHAGTLSVRHYEWNAAGGATTSVQRVTLDPRNRGEFAVHVVRHLLANLTKVLTGRNEALSDEGLAAAWERWLPNSAHLCGEYLAMVATKRSGAAEYGPRAVELAVEFVAGFAAALEELIGGLTRVVWMRHALTILNDGRFLGQRRDPSIADRSSVAPLEATWSAVRSSPARRAVETAALLAPNAHITHDPRLLEIDCGAAEGLNFAELAERFPALVGAWQEGTDAPFPEGESHADVLLRLDAAVADLQRAGGDVLVVTHNVVLRVLLGSRLGVPRRAWHRIAVGHLDPIETFVIGDRLVPHLPTERLGAIIDLRVHP
jgi:broad specificity phosphatase PhoE